MFPPFVNSFGDQFTAVIINMVGTVLAGLFSAVLGSFVTAFLTPVFHSLAAGIGLTAP